MGSYLNPVSQLQFESNIKQAFVRKHPTVFVMTAQELTKQLDQLNLDIYNQLMNHIEGMFIHKIEDLKNHGTIENILSLLENTESFVMGTTEYGQHKYWNSFFTETSIADSSKRNQPVVLANGLHKIKTVIFNQWVQQAQEGSEKSFLR